MAETQTPNDISHIVQQQQYPQNAIQNQNVQPNPQQQQQPQQQQAYIVYAPQMYQQRQQPLMYNQVQPINYPQFQQPRQFPQVVQPPQQQKTPEKPLKHEELSTCGPLERRFFHLNALASFLIFQALAFVLCLVSYHNGMVNISYDPLYGHFKPTLWVSMSIMIVSLLYSYTNTKKLRTPNASRILAGIYGVSYAFFIQGLYSSSYYIYSYYQYNQEYNLLETNDGDVVVILCFSFINLQVLSLFAYSIQEFGKLNFKGSFGYLTLPILTFGGICFAFYRNYGVLTGMIVFFLAFGFHLQFTLARIVNSSKFKLRSDDTLYTGVLLSFLILVPFFETGSSKSDEMIQESISDNEAQQNAQ